MQISLRSSPQTFGKTFSSRNKAGEDVGEQGAFHHRWHGLGDTRGLPAPCAASCARSRERTDIPPFTPFWVSLLSVCSRLHRASPSLHHCLPTPRDSGSAGCHHGPMCHCHPLSRFPCHHPMRESNMSPCPCRSRTPSRTWQLGAGDPPKGSGGTEDTGAPTSPPQGGCHPPFAQLCGVQEPHTRCSAPLPPAAPTPPTTSTPSAAQLSGDPPSLGTPSAPGDPPSARDPPEPCTPLHPGTLPCTQGPPLNLPAAVSPPCNRGPPCNRCPPLSRTPSCTRGLPSAPAPVRSPTPVHRVPTPQPRPPSSRSSRAASSATGKPLR